MGLFGRKRMKTRDAQGRKVVVVTDKRGTVRKTKIKDKKNQITTKERYDRAGNLTKRKAKGKYIKRFKAKTSNPTFDQSVFNDNQTVKNMVSGNPILNAKRNEMLQNGTDEQKKVQNNQVQNDSTQTNNTQTTTTNTENENKEVVNTENIEKKSGDVDKKEKSTEKSFGDAYREQRNKNTEAGIDHYGDDAGYFTWKGKKYNTETKEEKESRLASSKDVIEDDPKAAEELETPVEPKVDPTLDPTNTPDPDVLPDDEWEGPSTPTDTVPKIDTTIPKDTVARRGGSRGSYRSYRNGGAVGPNGIL